MILIPCVFVSVGLIIASSVDNVEGFQVIINFLVMPLFFLSGALFPLDERTRMDEVRLFGRPAPLWH